MTDRAAASIPDPAHPLDFLTNPTIALTREAEFYARELSRIDALIDARVQGIKSEFQARTADLRGEVAGELGAEILRTRRTRWYTAVLALLVVLCAAVLFLLATSMAQAMNRMTSHMEAMRDDIGAMRVAISRIDDSTSGMAANIKGMAANIKAMTGSLGAMNQGMANMNYTMGLMRQDTAMMQVSVGGMSKDTRAMGGPFRFMNSFMPW